MTNYQVVGASLRGVEHQDEKFIEQGIWMLGWEKGNQPKKASQMKPGDRIAIKRNSKFKITIEHITSQTPKNGLQFSDIEDDNFQDEYLHSIGNLTIDPKSSNSSKLNINWDNKDEKYFQKAPYKTQLELSDFVDETTKTWNSECINKRAAKIVKFSLNYWNPDNV